MNPGASTTVPELTAIEKLVVLRLVGGTSTHAIAHDLGVSPRTVEWHLARARHKLERTVALHEHVRDAGRDVPGELAQGGTT